MQSSCKFREFNRRRPFALQKPAVAFILSRMFRTSDLLRAILPITVVTALALPPHAGAWENEGHRMVNRLAAANLPADAPAFLRTPAALDEIEYLGPEPDRWRSPAEAELSALQA